MAAVGGAPRGTVIAEDVRDLQRWPGHGTRLRGPLPGFLLGMLRFAAKPIERAYNRGDAPGRNARIARRRIELVVAKNRLDQTDIEPLLEKMGGKGVPERMQRHRLLDAGRFGCLVEQARELTRGERLAAPPAGKQPALLHRHAFVVACGPHLPPLPKEIQGFGRQHDVAVLAALGLHDTDDVELAVDVTGLETANLAGA